MSSIETRSRSKLKELKLLKKQAEDKQEHIRQLQGDNCIDDEAYLDAGDRIEEYEELIGLLEWVIHGIDP